MPGLQALSQDSIVDHTHQYWVAPFSTEGSLGYSEQVPSVQPYAWHSTIVPQALPAQVASGLTELDVVEAGRAEVVVSVKVDGAEYVHMGEKLVDSALEGLSESTVACVERGPSGDGNVNPKIGFNPALPVGAVSLEVGRRVGTLVVPVVDPEVSPAVIEDEVKELGLNDAVHC